MRHIDTQKHVSYGINSINILLADSYKSFPMHYGLRKDLFFCVVLHCRTLCDAYTFHRQYKGLPQENAMRSFLWHAISGSNFKNYIIYRRQRLKKSYHFV